jgi:hypothetical protein
MNYIKTFEKYIDHNKLWWDLGLTTKSSSDDELELPLDDEDTNDKDKKDDSNEEDLPELSPELFENFKQEEITEFMSVIKDKVLELSDVGFNVEVEDKNSQPLLENMIRITVKKESRNPFKFSDVADISEDILLTNIQMGLYKKTHVIVTPAWRDMGSRPTVLTTRYSSAGERLSFIFSGDECIWSFERPQIRKMTSLTPLNLDCKCVELYFE